MPVRDTPHRARPPRTGKDRRKGPASRDRTGITPQQAEQHLDALTEIVARAAAATLAVPFSIGRAANQDRPVAGHRRRRGVRSRHPGRPRPAAARRAGGRRGKRRPRGRRYRSSRASSWSIRSTAREEFLAGRDEFTVNVAIVTDGVPIAGIIAAPAQGLLWRGVVGGKAERLQLRLGAGRRKAYDRSPIRTRPAPERLTVATSRSHLDEADRRLPGAAAAGQALPMRLVGQILPASRKARPTSIRGCRRRANGISRPAARSWRPPAAAVTDPDGGQLQFGTPGGKFLVPGFIAWGDPAQGRIDHA